MTDKPATRSFIEDVPLRQAGQSLRAQLHERFDEVGAWIGMFMLSLGLSLGMFGGYWARASYPYAHLILLVAPVGVFIRILLWRKQFLATQKNILVGEKGERRVGEVLDELRVEGYRVYHNILPDAKGKADVDHLVIGPGGIFVIETKARTRPETRKPIVRYDGQTLLVDGYKPDRDPIGQVKAIAKDVGYWLKSETGKDVSQAVRPVVVFPGWTIDESRRQRPYYEWVLHTGSVLTWIRKERPCLSAEEVALFASRVEARVRRDGAAAPS